METISTLPPELIRMVIAVIIIISFIFLNAIMMGYLERKIAGHVQRRLGPMEVGFHGILQLVVDGVKLVAKELLIPINVDRTFFRLAPILSFTPVILPLLVIPFSEKLQARDLNLGLLFIVSMTSVNVMAILVGGWGSNNKYSMFGAMRAVAQSIAYEIPILLSMLAIILMTNTLSLKEIVGAQQKIWFVLLQPLAFIIYVISGIAETNRAPFDLPEAESELTAGFHTEYSGIGFSLFFLGEYTNMFTVASVATVLFLGGWHGPSLPYGEYLGIVWFFLKVYFLLFFMIMIRWTYPRVRFDQLLNFAWKYLVPFSLVNILITAVVVKL
ncbi:MAG: NADH-quinone oxidoreductase subunit NuoH [Deltaproteobacteria bacterium]|nr:NADH-quinone oxidoreductase subunit NuoH [Deltaproteobacteria bacterium]MBW2619953.1 NADH-quinone oxidoreductase subunit NuoH [Deltaproteobacteria bacterium]